jgi:hypothetical protein
MRKARILQTGLGAAYVHEDGAIERITDDGFHVHPSDTWYVVSAVERNNFGNVVRRYSLEEVLTDPTSIPWKHRNGAQRVYLRDMDHGTLREWCNAHELVRCPSEVQS